MKSIFINPFTDFGFKKLFGEEASKPQLIDFLNSLLPEDIFIQAFEKAEIANYNKNELDNYNESLKVYRDLKNVVNYAFVEGKMERNIEIAIAAKKMGMPTKDISTLTGLSEEEIEKL